jgi:hypothetical protein
MVITLHLVQLFAVVAVLEVNQILKAEVQVQQDLEAEAKEQAEVVS